MPSHSLSLQVRAASREGQERLLAVRYAAPHKVYDDFKAFCRWKCLGSVYTSHHAVEILSFLTPQRNSNAFSLLWHNAPNAPKTVPFNKAHNMP